MVCAYYDNYITAKHAILLCLWRDLPSEIMKLACSHHITSTIEPLTATITVKTYHPRAGRKRLRICIQSCLSSFPQPHTPQRLTCSVPPRRSYCAGCTWSVPCTWRKRAVPGSFRPPRRADWTPCPTAAEWDCRMDRRAAEWRPPARTLGDWRSVAVWRLASAPELSCRLLAVELHGSVRR